jgi:antitoxin component HigA of HigAB toxin-antitoxin module
MFSINDDAEYDKALAQVNECMDNPYISEEQLKELGALTEAVVNYERKRWPEAFEDLNLSSYIKNHAETLGISANDIANALSVQGTPVSTQKITEMFENVETVDNDVITVCKFLRLPESFYKKEENAMFSVNTEEEYEKALGRIGALMDMKELSGDLMKELKMLACAVVVYERGECPENLNIAEFIEYRIDAIGLTPLGVSEDLKKLGFTVSGEKISSMIENVETIDDDVIAVCKYLCIPESLYMKEED